MVTSSGSAPFARALDLVRSFAQLGRNERKPKRLVDVLFAWRGDSFPPRRIRERKRSLSCAQARQAVNMRLAAGRAQQHGAETRRRARMQGDAAKSLFRYPLRLRVDRDKPQVRNQLAAAPQVTGDGILRSSGRSRFSWAIV